MFEAELDDPTLYERDAFEIVETIDGRDVRVPVLWVDPDRLDAPLYPEGVRDLIG